MSSSIGRTFCVPYFVALIEVVMQISVDDSTIARLLVTMGQDDLLLPNCDGDGMELEFVARREMKGDSEPERMQNVGKLATF